jgi:ribosomal protein S18 acetylase RimI-like enzyme
MASLAIRPFADPMLDDAAALLAERHGQQRAHEPSLPTRFAELDGARAAVLAAWQEPDAAGVVALRDGQLVGFLIGAPQIASVWGRTAWVRLGGHAVAPSEGADLYRDLYAALAPRWLARGCFTHYALMPSSDRAALEAWFALSFGQQQAHAIRELPAPELGRPQRDHAIEIRRAGPDDLEALLAVAGVVAFHQERSPIFGVTLPEHRAEWRADFTELLADPNAAIWIAVRDGVVLGFELFQPEEPNDAALFVPERCCELVLAGTRMEQRGRGIAQALTAHGLAQAHAAGYTHCVTDWRTTNLLASRFWPQQGFRPVAYRLTRTIDERIAWAPGLHERA